LESHDKPRAPYCLWGIAHLIEYHTSSIAPRNAGFRRQAASALLASTSCPTGPKRRPINHLPAPRTHTKSQLHNSTVNAVLAVLSAARYQETRSWEEVVPEIKSFTRDISGTRPRSGKRSSLPYAERTVL
ncbi:unnamed protein product, partial [Acanthoscelides obtectus]